MPKFGHKKAKNFGYGKQLAYAGFNALRTRRSNGSYSTVASHAKRWKTFCHWLKDEGNITNIRDIDQLVVETYGRFVADKVFSDEMSVDYGQNLLSTVNVVVETMREDRTIRISPSEFVGKRNHVRRNAPLSIDVNKVNVAINTLKYQSHHIAAAVLASARFFGMRTREALLMNYQRAVVEAKKIGKINVTEGTKGGRGKNVDRFIEVSKRGMEVLKENAQLQASNFNLIPAGKTYIQVENQIHNRQVRDIFQTLGLKFYHDARAAFACEQYKLLTGNEAPAVSNEHVQNKQTDLEARRTISELLGHSRIEICVSYVGSSK